MVHNQSSTSPLGLYYFNVCLADPQAELLTQHINHLRVCFALARRTQPFEIVDAVIMPDQLHMIWYLEGSEIDPAASWRQIKSSFSRHMPTPDHRSETQVKRGDKGIWQRRFWQHTIQDYAEYLAHREYMWRLPVAMGHVDRPTDWEFSSIHRNLAKRTSTPKWGNGEALQINAVPSEWPNKIARMG